MPRRRSGESLPFPVARIAGSAGLCYARPKRRRKRPGLAGGWFEPDWLGAAPDVVGQLDGLAVKFPLAESDAIGATGLVFGLAITPRGLIAGSDVTWPAGVPFRLGSEPIVFSAATGCWDGQGI